jgi:septal ring factor EnvC (AmiA/AmiB activator)
MKYLFPLLLISFATYAAVPRRSDELARTRSEVMEMGARLSTLEKEISSKTNLYQTSLEQIKQFENDVKLYRERLKEIHRDVSEAREENRKILQSYLLESENDSTEPWQRKVHLELLKKAQGKLKSNEEELTTFENKVKDFDVKLAELRKNEEELSHVITELESRKKVAMEKYMERVHDKKVAEKKLVRAKVESKLQKVREKLADASQIQQRPDRYFGRPVEDFLSYTASPKGVTFRYKSVQPVKAVGGGKVVFAGDLASYGQVVLIDHGSDLRTVLLGKMNIKVKKNDTVKDGDILAYTQSDLKESQNLYFEVRKKNTAQNTILWLDLGGVSKI